jgi:RNA polymerase sigma-70 factor (ECF subfamily)
VDDVTALAIAARGGDRIALAAFVRATQPDVWRFCAHLGSGPATEDWAQETYARALRALPAYRAEAPAKAWLLGIARRVAADAVRSEVRRRRIDERARAHHRTARRAAAAAGPPDHVDGLLLLDALDPDRRAAFVLTQVIGLTYDEAAAACACAVGTIRSRVARARAQLVTAWAGGAEAGAAAPR